MGRYSTGTLIAETATRISLTYLLKKKFIVQGKSTWGKMNWSNGCELNLLLNFADGEKYVLLMYDSMRNGEVVNHQCKIQLVAVPSNLGKGEVLYFACPVTHTLCRVLYLSNTSLMFVSRRAFTSPRLLYRSQTSSKMNRGNERYWSNDGVLKELSKSRKETFAYNGKKTRYALRVERLLKKKAKANKRRWSKESMPMKLRRAIWLMTFKRRKA